MALLADLEIARIRWPDELNGRLDKNLERIRELADNIAAVGLINPVTVRRTKDGFEGIAGRTRCAAFALLGKTHIPAIELTADDQRAGLIRLTENIARSNLSPIEEAHQLAAIVEADPDGVDGTAAKLGRGTEWILARLEILSYDPALQAHIHAKKISLSAAHHLQRIPNPEARARLIADAAHHGITAATARLWLQHATAEEQPPPPVSEFSIPATPAPFVAETKALCFACEEYEPIETTHPMRVCNGCLQTIAQAKRNAVTLSP